MDESLVKAIALWKSSERLSLSDLLIRGDAKKMHFWRLFLQIAYDTEYELSGRNHDSEYSPDLSALSNVFETIMLLIEELSLVLPSFVRSVSVALLLWCVHLLAGLEQSSLGSNELFHAALDSFLSNGNYAPTHAHAYAGTRERIVSTFQRFLVQITQLSFSNHSLPYLIAEFMKRMMCKENAWPVADALLSTAEMTSTKCHPRLLFFTSWLLKDDLQLVKKYQCSPVLAVPSVLTQATIEGLTSETRSFLRQIRGTLSDINAAVQLPRVSPLAALEIDNSLQSRIEMAAQALVSLHVQFSLNLRPRVDQVLCIVPNPNPNPKPICLIFPKCIPRSSVLPWEACPWRLHQCASTSPGAGATLLLFAMRCLELC